MNAIPSIAPAHRVLGTLSIAIFSCRAVKVPRCKQQRTHSTIIFSLSDPVVDALEVLFSFLGGFSFFSGLPSLIVRDLSALLVRFLADPSSTGEDVGTGFGV